MIPCVSLKMYTKSMLLVYVNSMIYNILINMKTLIYLIIINYLTLINLKSPKTYLISVNPLIHFF